jgi:long-chain acyl-CoA synthetase
MESLALDNKSIRAVFGQEKTACIGNQNTIDLHVKIPIFGSNDTEYLIFEEPGRIYQKLGFHLLETKDKLAGTLVQKADFPLEENTYKVYLNFLELTKDWSLFRVWHYVPYINEDTQDLENYRSFCKGRSLAFEAFYGKDFEVKLPAASAVGINDDYLVMYFIAGKEEGTHIENYEQVPAFKYPQKYGPRAPSFARGTVISQKGKDVGYVSGTASIKSSESVSLQTIAQQLHTTMDNMSIVCEQMGLGERGSFSGIMPDPAKYDRHFKVYIRHPSDVQYIQEEFPKIIGATDTDQIIYLRSDICRFDLDLEIEAIVEERKPSMLSLTAQEKNAQTVEQMFLNTVKEYPNKTAIVYGESRLTYQELYSQILSLSKGLSLIGIKRSDCVMLVLPNCPEFVISFYAISKLQAIALALNPMFKASELQYYADDSNTSVIITDQARAEVCRQVISKLNHKVELIIVDAVRPSSFYFYHLMQPETDEKEQTTTFAGDILYQYSSGSTGRPKKLAKTQKQLYHQATNSFGTLKVTSADTILALVPLYHSYGLGECLLATMSTGATLVILEPIIQGGKSAELPLLFRRERILELIEQEKVTVIPIVPYVASILASTPEETKADLSSLRLCLSAGNFLSQDIFEQFSQRFGVPLRQLYGCTEVGAVCVNMEDESELQYDSIGKPMNNVEITILDDEGNKCDERNECGLECIGEIVIKTQGITSGYTNMPELNKKAFSGGCFFTGDLGKKDEKGRIYLTGRKKMLIDVGGDKVDPLEVEDVLITHPKVEEAVVVGTKATDGVELTKAVIVANEECSEQEILAYCKERIADFKVPRMVEFRKELPKDPVFGKVQRKKV